MSETKELNFLNNLLDQVLVIDKSKTICFANLNREKDKQKEKEENISQDEEILDKLKDKNLSEEDLKNLYKEIKNKDKEDK